MTGLSSMTPNIIEIESCESTNKIAKEVIDAPGSLPDGIVIVSRQQTKGAGTRSRAWFSPKDSGVYLSAILQWHDHMPDDPTLLIGYTLANKLRIETRLYIRCNGINDLYVDNRKLGGILCEKYKDYFIIGIGLNTKRPKRFPVRFSSLKKTAVWLDEVMPIPGVFCRDNALNKHLSKLISKTVFDIFKGVSV